MSGRRGEGAGGGEEAIRDAGARPKVCARWLKQVLRGTAGGHFWFVAHLTLFGCVDAPPPAKEIHVKSGAALQLQGPSDSSSWRSRFWRKSEIGGQKNGHAARGSDDNGTGSSASVVVGASGVVEVHQHRLEDRFAAQAHDGAAQVRQQDQHVDSAILCANTPKQSVAIPSFIHFVSMDIEGQEENVLSTFPFDDIKVGAWVIESTSTGGGEANGGGRVAGVTQTMARHGYRRVPVQNPGVDAYFVGKGVKYDDALNAKPWREHPEGSSGC